MKKDVFSTWLKEFASLVFLQTIQSIVFMIIIVIIVKADNINDKNAVTVEQTSALSVLMIVALASISKIELLVKKLFGVDSSVADPSMKGGMKSLAMGMMAFKMAGRALNNVPKMGKGAMDVVRGSKEKKQIKTRFARDMKIQQGKLNGSTQPSDNNNAIESQNEEEGLLANPANANNANNAISLNQNRDPIQAQVSSTNKANSNIDRTAKANSNIDTTAIQEKMNSLRDSYDDALSKAKHKQLAGVANIASGLTESLGGAAGGLIGGIGGLATGEIDEAFKAAGMGVGIGDYIGSAPIKAVQSAGSMIGDFKSANMADEKYIKELTGAQRKNIIHLKQRREQRKEAERNLDRMHDSIDAGNL
ncbi:MAG: hypothetical protein RSA08_04285 [Clostridia bacterium]